MGYDRSVFRNYGWWARGIFVGRKNVYMDGKLYDCPAPCLGISITTGEPVSTELAQRYPATLTVAVGGAAFYLTGGVVLGALAARWRGRTADRMIVGSSLMVSSIPTYLLVLLAWIFLSLKVPIFPHTSYYPITENPLKTIEYMMLPWLVIGMASVTDYARFTRGQLVETLNEDYVRTAQAKGLTKRRRLFKHALRAAIVPVITIFGLDFATLLAGTVFVEQIFGINGIAYWGLSALETITGYPDGHQRHQRLGAGRGGPDRGGQPGGRRAARFLGSPRHRRLTSYGHRRRHAQADACEHPRSSRIRAQGRGPCSDVRATACGDPTTVGRVSSRALVVQHEDDDPIHLLGGWIGPRPRRTPALAGDALPPRSGRTPPWS